MFNLDHEIARWRQTMIAGGVSEPAVLDELESHLRDFVAEEVRSGGGVEQAFEAGLERIGQASVLKREFSRANKLPFLAEVTAVLNDRRKCFWSALVLSVLAAAGFYYWRMRVTPVYRSIATLQLMQRLPRSVVSPQLVAENDPQSAERLNTFVHLLTSGRLRTQVAKSLTPAELQIVRRTTAARQITGGTKSEDDLLGALTVGSLRTSHLVTLSVVHEDAEAAALIVNRYVEQCRLDLRNAAEFPDMTFRLIDRVGPARQPFAPNRTQILQASEALALVTFVGLLLTAAALRKLASMRMTAGREMRTS